MPMAPIVYVMGPSGAGKDTVLSFARARLDSRHPVAFAHRYITRPPLQGDENHIALSPAEFAARKTRGLFAMHWEAHGHHYGIGIEIEKWREAGLTVVVSGSRTYYLQHLAEATAVIPLLITCDPAVLARRLAARAREDGRQQRQRLERGAATPITHPALMTIDNSGPIERAGERLVELLLGLLNNGR